LRRGVAIEAAASLWSGVTRELESGRRRYTSVGIYFKLLSILKTKTKTGRLDFSSPQVAQVTAGACSMAAVINQCDGHDKAYPIEAVRGRRDENLPSILGQKQGYNAARISRLRRRSLLDKPTGPLESGRRELSNKRNLPFCQAFFQLRSRCLINLLDVND
jgi:hypothetical protein